MTNEIIRANFYKKINKLDVEEFNFLELDKKIKKID